MGVLLAIMPEPGIATVVITGVSLVFMILVALALIIVAQGKVFDGIAASKKQKAEVEKAKIAASAAAVASTPVVEAPAPVVEDGISAEVVAAITAALACMDGGKYRLRTLRKAERSRWELAGVISDTEPF